MKFRSLLLIAITLSALSCRKNATDDYPEFIGVWFDNSTVLTIEDDGTASYEQVSSGFNSRGNSTGTSSSTLSGRMRIKNDELLIGGRVLKKTFVIDAYPTEFGGGLNVYSAYMVLDGDSLFRF